jgi:hypothetical protein
LEVSNCAPPIGLCLIFFLQLLPYMWTVTTIYYNRRGPLQLSECTTSKLGRNVWQKSYLPAYFIMAFFYPTIQ